MYKNHEGYNDPTAGKAIRRADRSKKKGVAKRDTLTYRLEEVSDVFNILKAKR